VTVALSGDGGDEAWRATVATPSTWRRRARDSGFRRRSAARSSARSARCYPRSAWLPKPLRAATTFREMSVDASGAYVRMVSALPDETRATLLGHDFRRDMRGYDPGDVVRHHFNVRADLDPLQRAQYADVMTYLPGDILTKVDRASMANSLEMRSPMLDTEFFTWSFNLPPHAKLSRSAGGKACSSSALESRLPKDLLYRPKQGFTVPLARWLSGPLREQTLGLADSAALEADGAVDIDAVRAWPSSTPGVCGQLQGALAGLGLQRLPEPHNAGRLLESGSPSRSLCSRGHEDGRSGDARARRRSRPA
jgi:asparagine synthase (glutamine-hydrolysing)